MATPKTLISIITPTYNAEKYIEHCIESVQQQTFSEYEHLVIDGLSTDRTIGIVKRCQKKFPNLKLFTQKDAGVYDAMNKGIQLAQSEWLYFLGADDLMATKDVLQIISEEIKKGGYQIIYGNVVFKNTGNLYDKEFDIEKILTRNICHQAVFYHLSVFTKIGMYNLRYSTKADYDLNVRCWLSREIKHLYVGITIALYADGGLSSVNEDGNFIEDYPYIVLNSILKGNRGALSKIHFLSIAYRKIFQRYPLSILGSEVFKKDFFIYRFLAICWMIISVPFYFFKKTRI